MAEDFRYTPIRINGGGEHLSFAKSVLEQLDKLRKNMGVSFLSKTITLDDNSRIFMQSNGFGINRLTIDSGGGGDKEQLFLFILPSENGSIRPTMLSWDLMPTKKGVIISKKAINRYKQIRHKIVDKMFSDSVSNVIGHLSGDLWIQSNRNLTKFGITYHRYSNTPAITPGMFDVTAMNYATFGFVPDVDGKENNRRVGMPIDYSDPNLTLWFFKMLGYDWFVGGRHNYTADIKGKLILKNLIIARKGDNVSLMSYDDSKGFPGVLIKIKGFNYMNISSENGKNISSPVRYIALIGDIPLYIKTDSTVNNTSSGTGSFDLAIPGNQFYKVNNTVKQDILFLFGDILLGEFSYNFSYQNSITYTIGRNDYTDIYGADSTDGNYSGMIGIEVLSYDNYNNEIFMCICSIKNGTYNYTASHAGKLLMYFGDPIMAGSNNTARSATISYYIYIYNKGQITKILLPYNYVETSESKTTTMVTADGTSPIYSNESSYSITGNILLNPSVFMTKGYVSYSYKIANITNNGIGTGMFDYKDSLKFVKRVIGIVDLKTGIRTEKELKLSDFKDKNGNIVNVDLIVDAAVGLGIVNIAA